MIVKVGSLIFRTEDVTGAGITYRSCNQSCYFVEIYFRNGVVRDIYGKNFSIEKCNEILNFLIKLVEDADKGKLDREASHKFPD